jgi:CheY-like chemotaxis protein
LPNSDEEVRSSLEQITQACQRATATTGQLLALSRSQSLGPEVLNLNDVLKAMEDPLQRMIGEDIQVQLVLAEDLDSVKIDRGQAEQAVWNLAANARDAMPRGGRLTLATSNLVVEEQASVSNLRPGRYVQIIVRDNGAGMAPDVQARIFETFFTTKEVGRGTGLGLSMVSGFVRRSAGHIDVESLPDRGSAFRILLPCVKAKASREKASSTSGAATGSETILVVEDDDGVRSLVCRVLRNHGYLVLEAPHPGEALRLAEESGGPVDLLLTDVVMPESDGLAVAKQIRSRHPNTKILYISGYSAESISRHELLSTGGSILPKPFSPDELHTAVRCLLDDR